jgi:hypothetical protein
MITFHQYDVTLLSGFLDVIFHFLCPLAVDFLSRAAVVYLCIRFQVTPIFMDLCSAQRQLEMAALIAQ